MLLAHVCLRVPTVTLVGAGTVVSIERGPSTGAGGEGRCAVSEIIGSMGRVHCFRGDALGSLDAVGVAGAIKAGLVSREEVIEAAIARVEHIEPRLHAVQVACFERARSSGAATGTFSGVPSFVKDDIDVRGLPTGHGSAAFEPRTARRNAAPARQFLAQGFALVGKSKLPEFGLTASTEYVDRDPTCNPWSTAHSAGGSSGGAGALVASGAVPIAHANDGGGSIRIPAAANGLVGLKMTRCRLLDQAGVRQAPVNFVCEGVLTRSVRDTAHYLAAAERYRAHPKLPEVGLVERPAKQRLRIGMIAQDVYGRPVHPETQAVLRSAALTLATAGHELTEMQLAVTPQFAEDFKLYWAFTATMMCGLMAASHRGTFQRERLDPFTRGLTRFFTRNAAGLVGAIRRLRRADRLYDAQFANVDVLLTPVVAHPAPTIGEHRPDQRFETLLAKLIDYVAFTPVNNVVGAPAIALPHGMMEGRLPGSIQLSAPRGGERTLLQLAYELEAITPFPQINSGSSMSPLHGTR
jgi:amidase